MTASALLDEMLSPAIADQLRRRGHDVTSVADDPELVGRPDEDILAAATAQGRALVTCNIRDLVPVAQAWQAGGRAHTAIVCVPLSAFPQQRGFAGAVVTALDLLLSDDRALDTNDMCFLQRT